MTRLSLCPKVAALAFAAVLAISTSAQALPIVVPTVTSAGPLFHYDYSITNDQAEDLILVSILATPGDASLTNLFAPSGFLASYDSGLGLVDFLPVLGGLQTFAAMTTLSGFGFDSLFGPGPSTFDALAASGLLLSGPTTAPVAAAPEPAPVALLVIALAMLFGAAARRRLAASS